MDLSQILPQDQLEQPAVLHLTHPVHGHELFNGDIPMTISLLGGESTIAKQEIKKRAQRQLNSRLKSESIDALMANNVQFLAKLTMGWTGMSENGEPIELTLETAIDTYTKHQWIREQVDAFISDRANFTKA